MSRGWLADLARRPRSADRARHPDPRPACRCAPTSKPGATSASKADHLPDCSAPTLSVMPAPRIRRPLPGGSTNPSAMFLRPVPALRDSSVAPLAMLGTMTGTVLVLIVLPSGPRGRR